MSATCFIYPWRRLHERRVNECRSSMHEPRRSKICSSQENVGECKYCRFTTMDLRATTKFVRFGTLLGNLGISGGWYLSNIIQFQSFQQLPLMSHLVRFWYLSSSVNSFFKRACAAIQWRLDVWFLVGPFVYLHTSCMRTAKVLVRLRLSLSLRWSPMW